MNGIRYLLGYSRKYAGQLAMVVASMVLLVGIQLAAPAIVSKMISTVTEGTKTAEALQTIVWLALAALAMYVARAGLAFVRSYMAHKAGWGVVADARRNIYEHLQLLSLRFYEDRQVGQLMSRMINDSDLFERFIAHAIPDVLVNGLTFFGVSAVMLSINWRLALLSMVPIPLVALSMQAFSKWVRPAFRERQHELGELNARLNDNLSGIREIKAFTQEDMEAERIGRRIYRFRDSNLRALRLMATFDPLVELSSSLGMIVVIYFGGRLALDRVLSVGELVAFFLYLEIFYGPVRVLSTAWESIQETMAGLERVAELLQTEPDVADCANARRLTARATGALELRNVSFAYGPDEPLVLDGINLDIPKGTSVALVGRTGVGKTTLTSLIPRFYDVCDGAILLDGQDIRDLELKSLRQQISIVLQDVFLFHGTVRENVLFGRPTASEEELIEATKVANAYEFIARLPHGFDTLIGERGVKLSGGQKQRLAIARAVLKDAPVLVLDEATSSVDTETEMLIQEALERLMAGRTTIIIAHRLSTVRNADKIVVLEGSRIVEMGTHAELMARDGLYCHLNEVQMQLNASA